MNMTSHLDTFIKYIQHYFTEYNAGEVEMGVPFVNNGQEVFLDITGCIAISGQYMGAVYVSMTSDMVGSIARIVLASDTVTQADLVDMMGEFTNTIAGNVRRQLGSGFDISVPMVIQGLISEVNVPRLNQPIYAIPFKWSGQKAYLLVGLEQI